MKLSIYRLAIALFLGLWANQAPALEFSGLHLDRCGGQSDSPDPVPPNSRRCGGTDSQEEPEPPTS